MDIDEYASTLILPKFKGLYPFQRQLNNSKSKKISGLLGRKSGKSMGLQISCAYKLEHHPIFCDTPHGEGLYGGILIVSKNLTVAKRFLGGIKGILSQKGWTFTKERWKMDRESRIAFGSVQEICIPREGGRCTRCMALAAGQTGDAIRPFSFHIKIHDEADFQKEDVYESTAACLAVTDGQEILISTPNPSVTDESYFYKACHDKDYEYIHHKTSEFPHVPKSYLVKERKKGRAYYDREYNALFVSSDISIYSRNLLASCRSKNGFDKKEIWKIAPICIGVDFARYGNDDNAIAFAHWNGEKALVWVTSITGRQRTTVVTRKIRDIINRYPGKVKHIVTDSTGVGAGPTDALIQEFGSYKVIGVDNAKRTDTPDGINRKYIKADLYTNLLRMMEYGRVEIDHDSRMVGSLHSMTWKYVQGDVLSVQGSNSHIAEAVVRAVYPFFNKRPGAKATIISIPHDKDNHAVFNKPKANIISV